MATEKELQMIDQTAIVNQNNAAMRVLTTFGERLFALDREWTLVSKDNPKLAKYIIAVIRIFKEEAEKLEKEAVKEAANLQKLIEEVKNE